MVKKEDLKEPVKISRKKPSKDLEKLNAMLIENFVNLQKVMTNLSVKFENLSDQMSKLLQLFEISARNFAEKLETGTPNIEKDKDFLEKIDKLLDQNKTIAKGLTLMEEKMRQRLYGAPSRRQMSAPPFQRPPEGYVPSSLSQEKTRFKKL